MINRFMLEMLGVVFEIVNFDIVEHSKVIVLYVEHEMKV